jgi:hypothetical protein
MEFYDHKKPWKQDFVRSGCTAGPPLLTDHRA